MKWGFLGIGVIIVLLLLSLGFGWFDVFYIKTVGKAKQDANREVFEQTQSYVEAKRQEALKLYKEYNSCEDEQCKQLLSEIVANSFAHFDEDKLPIKLQKFIYECKYK